MLINFMLSVRFLVNSRLLVVKFWGSQKFYVRFRLSEVLVSLTPVLFKGQLYFTLLLVVPARVHIWFLQPSEFFFKNTTRDMEIKNKLTVTRGLEAAGDNGEKEGKGHQGTCIKDIWTKPKG